MKVVRGEEIASSQQVLLDVFRDGYAERYVGDERFLEGYILPAHIAILDDRDKSLCGAALMRNSRVTAIATRTDRERYGSRFKGFVGLLQIAHLVDEKAWIGIGTDVKETVKVAAREAGMTRSQNEELLSARLAKSGKLDNYVIRPNAAGLLICLANSNQGVDYWQEVWDWSTE